MITAIKEVFLFSCVFKIFLDHFPQKLKQLIIKTINKTTPKTPHPPESKLIMYKKSHKLLFTESKKEKEGLLFLIVIGWKERGFPISSSGKQFKKMVALSQRTWF